MAFSLTLVGLLSTAISILLGLNVFIHAASGGAPLPNTAIVIFFISGLCGVLFISAGFRIDKLEAEVRKLKEDKIATLKILNPDQIK
ncbi:MAG: hypothetical protein HYT62_03305 [Candidatus Yanofskybacteria bacterium]|nr:hypothetical protein [Candidatus Yanofskybacteria bacterium]